MLNDNEIKALKQAEQYAEGRQAYRDGFYDNPYTKNEDAGLFWLRGWDYEYYKYPEIKEGKTCTQGHLQHNLINLTNPLKTNLALLTERLNEVIDLDSIQITDRPGARTLREVLAAQRKLIIEIEDLTETLF